MVEASAGVRDRQDRQFPSAGGQFQRREQRSAQRQPRPDDRGGVRQHAEQR